MWLDFSKFSKLSTKCMVEYPSNKHLSVNKKSTESGVAPAGIKSHKFLFELKKIYFAVFKRLMA